MRYAVYFTPPADHPLTRAAARWLGRDAFSGDHLAQPAVAGLAPERFAALTASPRRYGFHATLKPPLALAEGTDEAELLAVFHAFAAARAPCVERLAVSSLDGFLALTPVGPAEALHRLGDDCVRAFERFRAPAPAGEIAQRRAAGLTPRQDAHLVAWGYPHVFEDFRFHMTLTERLAGPEAEGLFAAARSAFDPLLTDPVAIDRLALFVEPSPGAPFTVRALAPLGG